MTSSIIAAVTRTVPTLVVFNFTEDRIANVVPREVDDNAAPAAKAVNLNTPAPSGMRINDNAMGRQIPVKATRMAGIKVCLSNFTSVERPPTINPRRQILGECLHNITK